jgi:hypothetical protein
MSSLPVDSKNSVTQKKEIRKMDKDMTRDDLLALLADIGGHGADLQDADDATLAAIARNRLALVTDAAAIERALSKPLSVEWRGRLVGRRIELEQIAKVAAAPKKVAPYPGLSVFVPQTLDGMTHFFDGNGSSHEVRIVDGRRVLDMTPSAFMAFLGGPNGLDWSRANEGTGVFERMRPGVHAN